MSQHNLIYVHVYNYGLIITKQNFQDIQNKNHVVQIKLKMMVVFCPVVFCPGFGTTSLRVYTARCFAERDYLTTSRLSACLTVRL